jgi:Ca-activated chloride channel family protein
MPQFAHPWWLLLALAIPLLVWAWQRRDRGALLFSDTRLLTHLPRGRERWVPACLLGLRCLTLLLLVLALAGPRWPDLRTRLTTHGIAIVLLLDVSGSMGEHDFGADGEPTSRLDAVKEVFRQFVAGDEGLPGRSDDLIGLVTFATRPESACPLTLSHDVLLQILDRQQPRTLPDESQTNLGDAIAWGLHRLESAGSLRKVLVLLSDGEHNVPPPALKPRQAAQLAAGLHVPIYAIDAGSDTTEDKAGSEHALQAVAKISGGQYYRASDAATLREVYRHIDRLERREIESFQYRRYYEGYAWLGTGALTCWVLVRLLDGTAWRRLP